MSKARVRAYGDGVLAETLAAILFSLKGYRIIVRRYRSPVGEVDLVATNGERLAFVEVKRGKTQAHAAFAVTAKQKRRIMRAAQYWLSSHPHFVDYAIGFDVVLCALCSWPRHVKNAFPI